MAITQPAAPGVYLNEPPPAVPHQVLAAPTSQAAFPGVYPMGPVGVAIKVNSWDDFVNQYGPLTDQSSLATLAVWQFYQNGGTTAFIIRLDPGDMAPARAKIGGIWLTARSAGQDGNTLTVGLQPSTALAAPAGSVDFMVWRSDPSQPLETLTGLGCDPSDPKAPCSPAKLAEQVTAGSQYFTAVVDPSVGTPYTPVPRSIAFPTDGVKPLGPVNVAGITLTVDESWWKDVDVQLTAPVSGEQHVLDFVITQTLHTKDTNSTAKTHELEHLYDLRIDTPEHMAHDLGASKYFSLGHMTGFKGTWPPKAGEIPLDADGSATIGNIVTLEPVPVPPWQQGLAVSIVGDEDGEHLDLTLTNVTNGQPAQLEYLSKLPSNPKAQVSSSDAAESDAPQSDAAESDPSQSELQEPGAADAQGSAVTSSDLLPDAINAASNFLTAAVDSSIPAYQPPPKATANGGSDGTWNLASLQDALLAQFGDSLTVPAPIPALDQISPDVFNLMCIPDVIWLEGPSQIGVLQAAQKYCQKNQAFLIVDTPAPAGTPKSPVFGTEPSLTLPPLGSDVARQSFLQSMWKTELFASQWFSGAAYYPWVKIPNPNPGPGTQPLPVPPSGTVAGIYASTDAARHVWKAPAGIDADLSGVVGLTDSTMSDVVNADLNGAGINCLRVFPIYGTIVWGARTMAGADLLQSGWKYVPVRRLADFIEQSLLQSLKWAVFEPNEPPLWASIRLEVTAFMNALYGQGAFDGTSAASAYQVVCDNTTTSKADQLAGVVNVFVGFQPAEPAEFVVLTVQLNAGAPASS